MLVKPPLGLDLPVVGGGPLAAELRVVLSAWDLLEEVV